MELSDTDLKQIVLKLAETVKQRELKVTAQKPETTNLTKEITDRWQERVLSQEKYSSKDCWIFYNLPVNATSKDLDVKMCRVLKFYFSYEL